MVALPKVHSGDRSLCVLLYEGRGARAGAGGGRERRAKLKNRELKNIPNRPLLNAKDACLPLAGRHVTVVGYSKAGGEGRGHGTQASRDGEDGSNDVECWCLRII